MNVFLLIVAFVLGVLCASGVFLAYKYDLKAHFTPQAKVKKWLFLFRWFLIGRYHCNLPHRQKVIINALNKLFWGIVVISLAVCLGDILQWI